MKHNAVARKNIVLCTIVANVNYQVQFACFLKNFAKIAYFLVILLFYKMFFGDNVYC